MPSPAGAPLKHNGKTDADDLALATSANEPTVVHDARDIDIENGSGPSIPGEDVYSKSMEESNGNAEKVDAIPSIDDAEQEGGKYGVRAVIGGFGIT